MRSSLLLIILLLSTVLSAQPVNDACLAALPIACGETAAGSTVDATVDAVGPCGTSITAPGVWYMFIGTGQQVVATTCPDNQYDTKLNVYTASCGALVCVAGNDDIAQGVYCSSVGFVAEAGLTYYILVQGYNDETGPFDLAITCSAVTPDQCQGALPIACGETVQGSTVDATEDSAPFCGTEISAAGVWYSFIGNGGQMSLSTCADEQYDTKLNVYEGPCNALVCMAGNDDANPDVLCSTVTFASSDGVEYHVLVQGYGGEVGPFSLSLSCPECGAPTNVMVSALDQSATVTWTTPNPSSAFQVEYGPAGFTPGSGTTITGATGITGPPVTINGLTPGTAYDVYVTEDCPGGSSPAAGPFAFTTMTEPPAANALCGGALPIACGGSVNGNTEQGLLTAAPTCGSADITSAGLWYAFTGTGDDVTLSTCGGSGYDTKISVFIGGCSAPACVAGNDDGPNCPGNTSSVVLQTIAGADYLVLVHGYGIDQGAFTLTMACAPPCPTVENDVCGSATLLTLQSPGGCESSLGTTVCAFAPAVPNPPCDPWANVVDTWYAFNTGTATDLQLIIETGTADLINAALYADCGEPVYIACWTEVSGSIALGALPADTELLVRVWNGGGDEAGTFSICVEGNLNTGISDSHRAATTMLFPIPADDVLHVNGIEGIRSLTLIDAHGQTALTRITNGSSRMAIGVGGLAPGIYVLVGDGRSLGRVIVSR
ncbi:MAG: hypothetical protein IPM46_10215 [Flavobacteriales bacterium]|nr:hypothetical protein [Flavobacteriales bacterium]